MGVGSKEDYELDERENDGCISDPPKWSQRQQYSSQSSKWIIGTRKMARSTDKRTAMATVSPSSGVNDSVPVAKLRTAESEALIVSTLNSFVFDYCTRNSIGGANLNFFIIKQLPVPHPADFLRDFFPDHSYKDFIISRALELVYTTSDLQTFAECCGYIGPPFKWDSSRRFLIKCELDSAFFHLYGLTYSEIDYVMESFPIVKQEDEKKYGEYHTKNTILEIFREMEDAISNKTMYRTRLDPKAILLENLTTQVQGV